MSLFVAPKNHIRTIGPVHNVMAMGHNIFTLTEPLCNHIWKDLAL